MLVDHHCHLDVPEFEGNREEIVARARRAGVGPIVTISMRVRQFDVYRAIAEAHEDLYFTVGTHPHRGARGARHLRGRDRAALAQHPRCVGIGEAGLDYYYKNSTPEAQATGLRTHIAAAREAGLPLVVHARDADDDIAAILEQEIAEGAVPGRAALLYGWPRARATCV